MSRTACIAVATALLLTACRGGAGPVRVRLESADGRLPRGAFPSATELAVTLRDSNGRLETITSPVRNGSFELDLALSSSVSKQSVRIELRDSATLLALGGTPSFAYAEATTLRVPLLAPQRCATVSALSLGAAVETASMTIVGSFLAVVPRATPMTRVAFVDLLALEPTEDMIDVSIADVVAAAAVNDRLIVLLAATGRFALVSLADRSVMIGTAHVGAGELSSLVTWNGRAIVVGGTNTSHATIIEASAQTTDVTFDALLEAPAVVPLGSALYVFGGTRDAAGVRRIDGTIAVTLAGVPFPSRRGAFGFVDVAGASVRVVGGVDGQGMAAADDVRLDACSTGACRLELMPGSALGRTRGTRAVAGGGAVLADDGATVVMVGSDLFRVDLALSNVHSGLAALPGGITFFGAGAPGAARADFEICVTR